MKIVNNMVVSKLKGGLGNWMFQIAVGSILAKDNNDAFKIYVTKAGVIHKPFETYSNNIFRSIDSTNDVAGLNVYSYDSLIYKKIPYSNNILLDGYFQSEKYLTNRQFVIELFKPDDNTLSYINYKYSGLLNSNTCSIHVRHGDYMKLKHIHGIQSVKYYQESMEVIGDADYYLVFSDDIKWCKDNFNGNKFIFIENEKDYIDLYIMSMCRNNIIANSSFSWWGAWMNNNSNKKVVCPSNWFVAQDLMINDVIPEAWIKISN
jgi:hypothetical protein